jgi:hypothetical protein
VIGGRVLDVSALLDAASGRTQYARALISTAIEHGITLCVPAAALAESWAQSEPAHRPFLELLAGTTVTVVDPLDSATADRVGLLARGDGPGLGGSLPVAHAAYSGLTRGWPVVSANPAALLALAPTVAVEPLP